MKDNSNIKDNIIKKPRIYFWPCLSHMVMWLFFAIYFSLQEDMGLYDILLINAIFGSISLISLIASIYFYMFKIIINEDNIEVRKFFKTRKYDRKYVTQSMVGIKNNIKSKIWYKNKKIATTSPFDKNWYIIGYLPWKEESKK